MDTSAARPMSFKRLMALERVKEGVFRSIAPAWPPGDGTTTFGGHVYAQAAYAASKTVGKGLHLHVCTLHKSQFYLFVEERSLTIDLLQNVTGHFILPGRIDTPFTYRVRHIRDGGSYCLRSVDVFQESTPEMPIPQRFKRLEIGLPDSNTPCFVATMSFKSSEKHKVGPGRRYEKFEHQSVPRDFLLEKYRKVLEGKREEDHPVAPGADALWWDGKYGAEWSTAGAKFPGIDLRKVDMRAYNGEAGEGGDGRASKWRQLGFYRIVGEDEEDETARQMGVQQMDEDEELHLAVSAHLYASDRNSLFLIQRAHGYAEREGVTMASLGHTVVFHGGVERLRSVDDERRRKWFIQEAWTSNSGENRGCHESRLWDWEAGDVIATTIQDGMMRIPRIDTSDLPRRRRAQRVEMERSDLGKSKL